MALQNDLIVENKNRGLSLFDGFKIIVSAFP
jgi:hypothetical protein